LSFRAVEDEAEDVLPEFDGHLDEFVLAVDRVARRSDQDVVAIEFDFVSGRQIPAKIDGFKGRRMFERFVGQRDAASGDTAQAHRLGGTGNVTHFEIGCVEATQETGIGIAAPEFEACAGQGVGRGEPGIKVRGHEGEIA
jgi:hypothetical protein